MCVEAERGEEFQTTKTYVMSISIVILMREYHNRKNRVSCKALSNGIDASAHYKLFVYPNTYKCQ